MRRKTQKITLLPKAEVKVVASTFVLRSRSKTNIIRFFPTFNSYKFNYFQLRWKDLKKNVPKKQTLNNTTMPITKCPKHGETGIVEMCKHLAKKLNKGIYVPFFEVPVQTTRLCLKCFDKYKVKDLLKSIDVPSENIKGLRKQLKGTDEIEQNRDWYTAVLKHPDKKPLERAKTIYRDLMKTRGWKCVDCIDKIYIQYARRNNLKLPFEPFENTLFTDMYNDKHVLALEKKLDKLFKSGDLPWRDLKVTYRIESGNYRKPFTIKIFGVEAEPEQEAVIKAVEAFYKKRKRNQRRLVFNTELIWIYDEEDKRENAHFEFLKEVVVR
ncbi:hypothetical protein H9Y05_07805 [Crocinitomicaceae bacterium CZZ-1]|uniref:Uncharacterized protein n=1 Tax=Taishania pollutisoli TaxID=2766479 RepID=A0A8J6P914_9FLAO|nr:hypothetical protein [Taishania pollutisoli]MBC9812376.1 hypothetical protein [Taishania pollutisoli]